jgi:hypothetical protein
MRTLASLFVLAACSTTPPSSTNSGDPAPVGTPNGDPIAMTVGSAGGTLTSSDGGITIVVPAGAVTSDTTFSIQPITNTSFAPVSGGYRLAPSDITFATPVTLQFAYSDDELANSAPEAMTIVGQDALGYWIGHRAAALDTTAHTLSLDVTSFVEDSASAALLPATPKDADWTKTYTVRVDPSESSVLLGGTAPLKVKACFMLDENGGLANETQVQNQCVAVADGARIDWSVDGNTAGGKAGSVAGSGATATYTAPTKFYSPVWVTAYVAYKNRGLGYSATINLVCPGNLRRADATGTCAPETWSGTSHTTGQDGAVYDSVFTFATDPQRANHFVVQTGQVNITTQPPSSGDCTTTIEASHPIATNDGGMMLDETDYNNPVISGAGGTTVWAAKYTLVCPSGTMTETLPYSIAWWPIPAGGAPAMTAQNAMATIAVDGVGGSGMVIIARDPQ